MGKEKVKEGKGKGTRREKRTGAGKVEERRRHSRKMKKEELITRRNRGENVYVILIKILNPLSFED